MTDTKNSNREFEYDAMRAVAAITVVVFTFVQCNGARSIFIRHSG